MRLTVIIALMLGITSLLTAQSRLSGLWEGTITFGGIYSEDHHRFQMLLRTSGSALSGRSYVYLKNGEIIEMEIKGRYFGDWSMSIYDMEFKPIAGSDFQPPFRRKYQLLYQTSIWETTLNGYWQQIMEESLSPKRQRGRIFLKKLPQVAAKP